MIVDLALSFLSFENLTAASLITLAFVMVAMLAIREKFYRILSVLCLRHVDLAGKIYS